MEQSNEVTKTNINENKVREISVKKSAKNTRKPSTNADKSGGDLAIVTSNEEVPAA